MDLLIFEQELISLLYKIAVSSATGTPEPTPKTINPANTSAAFLLDLMVLLCGVQEQKICI